MNAELVASLARFQKRKAVRELSKTNFETLAKQAPPIESESVNSSTSGSRAGADSSLAAVSKRIALFEKQKKLETTLSRALIVARVGTGEDEKIFQADANALRVLSGYVRKYFPRSPDLPAPKELHLPDEKPLVFELFMNFSQKPKKPIVYQPGQYSEEPWISNAVSAWMMAYRLGAPGFEVYALSQFIQNCAMSLCRPWKYIEENVPPSSSLSQFSSHWVAWNAWLFKGRVNEYAGLRAARLVSQVKASTRDPRILDLDHWFSDCGSNINAECEHDPILQKQQLEAKRRRERPPPAAWGADIEAPASGRTTTYS